MNNMSRYTLFLICTVLFCAAPARADYVAPDIRHDQYGEFKVVVAVTHEDPQFWQFRLRNIANGMKVAQSLGGSMQTRVVLYSGGVKMLTLPMDPKVKEAIDAAREEGVHFYVCDFSLKGMNQDFHELYGVSESDVVPSGFAEVGWLANHGWAVDPIN